MENRIALRGLENERLNIRNAQPAIWQSIRSAFHIESGAFCAVIPDIEKQGRGKLLLNIEVPNLHISKLVILVDREVVGDRGSGRRKTILQGKRRRCQS